MIRLLADENLTHDLVRGILRRRPDVDLVKVQEVGLRGVDDPEIFGMGRQENASLSATIDELLLVIEYSEIDEWQNQFLYLPLR